MKKISTRLHAVLDYAYALVLLAAPWLFHFADVFAAKIVVWVSAILVLIVSFLTRYEGGFLKIIPMKVHLWIDVLLGLFLICSPWLFRFQAEAFLFFIWMGIVAILVGVFTEANPGHTVSRL